MKKTINLIFVMLLVLVLPVVLGRLELDDIHYDPAIISSGDEVDIIIQYHNEGVPGTEDKVGNKDYTFKATLEPDDDLTKEYVTMEDSEGDDLQGRIFTSGYYNKVFRVKVHQNAPAGSYEFKLTGRWYENNKPVDVYQYVRFKMSVKKQGIILDISNIETVPAEVRPGDNFIKLKTLVENVGEKDAKSVEVRLNLPEGLKSSYTNNNRIWAGKVNSFESKELTFFVDVDDNLPAGVYDIKYDFDYMDVDNNKYMKSRTIPFLVKPRPYLVVESYNGSGFAGESSKLYVKIKNTGSESAEAVDVRLIKQNSQPFELDVRSDYIGEIEPGESGLAVFNIKANSDAEIKEHDFKLLIRSKGDSDEGDDNIYTYDRKAKYVITGVADNKLMKYGLIGAGVVVVIIIVNLFWRKKK